MGGHHMIVTSTILVTLCAVATYYAWTYTGNVFWTFLSLIVTLAVFMPKVRKMVRQFYNSNPDGPIYANRVLPRR